MNRRSFLQTLGMAPAAAVVAVVPGAFAAGPHYYTAAGLAAAEFVPAVVRPGQFVWHGGEIVSKLYSWNWPVYDPSE